MAGFLDAESLMALYLAACILLAVIVHFFPIFDQRRLAGLADERLRPLGFFERPDRALLILFFGFVALALAVYLGWRLPLELQRMLTGSMEFQPVAPVVEIDALGRAAQVVGGVCFVLIALRMMRWSLIMSFAVTMLGLAVAAFAYVFS